MAKRRATIGDNPLDSVIPVSKGERSPAGDSTRLDPLPKPGRVIKERLTIHLPVDLIEKIKDSVYWTPGLTLAGLAEDAMADAVKKLEKEQGKPFLRRKANLKGGRPLK